jgi:hypothetical protein
MNGGNKSSYKLSVFRMVHSIWSNIFLNEWKSWLFISLFSFLLVMIWIYISQKYAIKNAFVDYFVISILFGTLGYLGLLTAKYRIFRLMKPIRGKAAFVIGITVLVISWGLAAYFILLAAVEVAKYWM